MRFNSFAGFGIGAATLTTVVTADSHDEDVINPSFDVSKFMAEPVTPQSTLITDKDDMRVKMELLIMKIQVKKCCFVSQFNS